MAMAKKKKLQIIIRPEIEGRNQNQRIRNLNNRKTLTIGDTTFDCCVNDLIKVETLGRGAYGIVEKVQHSKTGVLMAVKRMQTNSIEDKRILMDMDISMRVIDCAYTVRSYGALFTEGDVLICMELMDASMDRFYETVFRNNRTMPEDILGKIFISIVNALHYLHSQLNVIHRDPSNILINRKGEIKMCDFGISGFLVNSRALTVEVGSKFYMAPERIDPDGPRAYNIRSDIWSLGISMIEMASGRFPYQNWGNIFDQIKEVVNGESPKLPPGQFSSGFEDLIACCLQKKCFDRPSYEELLVTDFIKEHTMKETNVAAFVEEILNLPNLN